MYPHAYTLSRLLTFYKNFSPIWLCRLLIYGNIWVENTGKESANMINAKFMNTDVDDMIFDMNDYYISEK